MIQRYLHNLARKGQLMRNKLKVIISGLIIGVLLLGSGISFNYQPVSAADSGEQQLELPPFELPEKGNPKLDSQLNRLVSEQNEKSSSGPMQESSSKPEEIVRVIIECLPGTADVVKSAAGKFGTVETSYSNLVQVNMPVSQLEALAGNPGIRLVRTPMQFLPAVVTSEGVPLINGDDWQAAGYNGAGVKIGILDGGFYGYAARQTEGELPASITTNWAPSIGNAGTSKHGTGCAEIIYDIAPGAQYYFANFGTPVELGNAVNWMIAQGVDVISCSMGSSLGGPGNGTGIVCEMVDTARAAGVFWAQSIGNSAMSHWQGNWADSNNNKYLDFAGTDELCTVYLYPTTPITVSLKWNDTWGASSNDYDLILLDYVDSEFHIVDYSEYEQNGNDDPVEEIRDYTAAYEGYHYIAVYKYIAPGSPNFHLYTYPYSIEPSLRIASSSYAIPADSPNAIAVGAIAYGTPTTLEVFSSQGPTQDGRIKPDLVAPDGVSGATYGTSNGVEYLSGGTGFFGTSASAPHTAGAAALVKDRYSSYTPAQIQSFLEGRAVDLGAAGKDNLFGSGRLDLGTPPAISPPTVVTSAASGIAVNSAVLNGNLTGLGEFGSANVSFEWGTTSGALDHVTTNQTKTSTGAFSDNLTGLSSGVKYYFRAKATANPTVYGEELSFTTLVIPPAVTTNSATGIGANTATLHGSLDSLGNASSVNASFVWGTTSGNLTNETTPVSKSSTSAFSANLTGLSFGTKYYFKAKATALGATVYGSELSFTTQSPPTVTTSSATNIGANIATLHGNLDSLGNTINASVSFVWGTTSGNLTHQTPVVSLSDPTPLSYKLEGLTDNVTYYFRVKAVGEGTGYGDEISFTTMSSNCFIATAAYGSYLDSHVDTLRAFRDKYLMTNSPGQSFVTFYYRHSPPVAQFISEHDYLKPIVRAALMPAVVMSRITLNIGLTAVAYMAVILVITAIAVIMRVRRQKSA